MGVEGTTEGLLLPKSHDATAHFFFYCFEFYEVERFRLIMSARLSRPIKRAPLMASPR